MTEPLKVTTKSELLSLEILIDEEPVVLQFKSLNLIPGNLILNDDETELVSGQAMTLVMLKWALTPKSYATVIGLPPSSWDPILLRMNEVSESDLGKSPGSSSSSKSTARRSKRT